MKKVILLSIFLSSLVINAQNTIYIKYNNSMTVSNLNFGYAHQFGHSQIGGGFRYNFNNETVNNHIYHKNLDPNGIKQSIGAHVFYNYYLFRELKHIEPFLTFDSQYSYSETSTYYLSTSSPVKFGPFHWSENIIGVGFRVSIIEKLYLTQKIGYGGMLIIGQDKKLFKDKITWELGGSFQFGLAYQL